jgi:ATP-dependent DNA helicase RecG
MYRDRRQLGSLAEASANNDLVFIGRVISARQGISAKGRSWLSAKVADGPVTADLVWFYGIPYLLKVVTVGRSLVISGRVEINDRGSLTLIHPEIGESETAMENFMGVKPIYRPYPGLPQAVQKRSISLAVDDLAKSPRVLPAGWLTERNLPDPVDLLKIIHQPPNNPGPLPPPKGSRAFHQLATFELMFWRLVILAEKNRRAARALTRNRRPDPAVGQKFLSLLPFEPTPEQLRAAAEFNQDLQRDQPMNRLLQGEVGSGKTVVAGYVASLILALGRQVAVLAPTELLARQHYDFLAPLMAQLGFRTAPLTRTSQIKARRETLAGLRDGSINLVIGTQALLSKPVTFADLGLAIIDEQQRLGVRQRLALTRKSAGLDLMSMSATPIPRSLAQVMYGDLDITAIRGTIPGRQNTVTEVYPDTEAEAVYERFFQMVRQGERGFVVCPRIGELSGAVPDESGSELDPLGQEMARPGPGEDPTDPLYNLNLLASPRERQPRPGRDIQAIEALIREKAPDLRLGVIHGRQDPALRHKTMAEFRAGQLDILAATTIIEVGVDVPGANLMLVEGADNFGLSQLHQLRGRIGRGGGQGLFLALSSPQPGEVATARLKALTSHSDGFTLAEMDLQIRGPGEELGLRQSGWPVFRFVKLPQDLRYLPRALDLAEDLWPKLPDWPDLEARIANLAKDLAVLPEEPDAALGI